MKRGVRCVSGAWVCVAALLFACLTAGSAAALPKVIKSVPTRATFSATKAADGTITAKVSFTASDPRCLSGKRFLQKFADGNYRVAGGTLLYGGAYSDEGISAPFGFDGFGAPPNKGLFAPVSPAGKSPYVWQAIWPGSTPVLITNFHNEELDRHYETTVAAASAVNMGAIARASMGQGLPYFKATYNQGGKHYILKCGVLAKSGTEKLIAF